GDSTTEITGGPFTFTVNFTGPDSFDFAISNPIPDATTYNSPLVSDITFEVDEPTGATDIDFYLWAGATPGTIGTAIDTIEFVYNNTPPPPFSWNATLPAANINNLANGTYSWDI